MLLLNGDSTSQESKISLTILLVSEILVMGGILTAFIAPLLVPSQKAAEVKQSANI
ncbi:MAG: hypothetical protein WBG73_08955 [Coleofasciculaceae cyanobacterium]